MLRGGAGRFLAGAALIWPFFALVRRLFGVRSAVATSLLLALCPALNASVLYWGTMTEPLYLLCVFAGLWFAWVAADEGNVLPDIAAGASFALAYLTRPEGSFFIALGAFATPALAQTGTLSGKVVNEDGRPAAAVEVMYALTRPRGREARRSPAAPVDGLCSQPHSPTCACTSMTNPKSVGRFPLTSCHCSPSKTLPVP